MQSGLSTARPWSRTKQHCVKKCVTMGNAAKTELNRNYAGLGSNIQQNLVSSGLSNSAALPGALSGVERQRTTNLSALNEQISTQKAGFSSALAGDYLTNLTSALNNATQMDAQYGQNVVNQFTQGAQFAIPTLTDLLNSQSQYKTLALPQGPPPMNPGDLFTSLSSVLTANRGAGRAEEWLRNAQASAQSNAFWNFLGMGTGPAGAVGGAAAGAGIFG